MKNQTWLVAKTIYRTRIKGAGFWAMVISPFLIAAIYLLIGLFISSGVNQAPNMAVVNNPTVAQALKANDSIKAHITTIDSYDKAQSELTAGKIDGFLVEKNGDYTLIAGHQSAMKFNQQTFQTALTQLNLGKTAQRLGLTAADVKELLSPAKLTMKTQTNTGHQDGGSDVVGANIAIGTISSIVIFMLLMMYVGIIGQEIGNEKSSRIMETLLAATSSNVQYYGKITGVIMLAATQIGIYVFGFGIAYPFIKDMDQVRAISGMLSGITLGFEIYVVLMAIVGILGYLFLASIIASLVNEQAQVQQATQPIAFLSMIGYIGGIAGSTVPGNVILKVLSFVPFISPTLMTSRFAIQYSNTAEAWIALVLQLFATIAVAKAGEKIYSRNVLSYSDEKIITQLFNNILGKENKPKVTKEVVEIGGKNSWFVKRNSGLGYRPNTWQGWLIVVLVIVIIFAVQMVLSQK